MSRITATLVGGPHDGLEIEAPQKPHYEVEVQHVVYRLARYEHERRPMFAYTDASVTPDVGEDPPPALAWALWFNRCRLIG